MIKTLTLLLGLLSGTNALELTDETWDKALDKKIVFVAFKHPDCEKCKKLTPDWDRLMEEFENHSIGVVAQVICDQMNGLGKELCTRYEIRGLPSIMYGDPSYLQIYEGEKDFESLKAFAEENLKPMCGISYLDQCDDETKTLFEKFLAMDTETLDAAIEEQEKMLKDSRDEFFVGYSEIIETNKKLTKEKEQKIEEIKREIKILKDLNPLLVSKEVRDEL